jgi:hypothetical protein
MATRILAATDTTPGANVPPQITMILTEHTWTAARAERDRRRRAVAIPTSHLGGVTPDDAATPTPGAETTSVGISTPGTSTLGLGTAGTGAAGAGRARGGDDDGDGADRRTDATPGDHAGGGHRPERYPPATLEDGTPVPVSELAVAMCDCEITRLVVDAQGVPLDLGRAQRVFTGAQRRAVIARDRECAWPDCHTYARWCHIHHVLWWERDTGPTSVDNGVLLCSFHHHEVHRRDLTITRAPRPGRANRSGAPPDTLAGVGYEFRDRTGHLVGASARRPTGSDTGSDTARRPPDSRTGAQPLLDWAAEPVTGTGTPELVLTG